MGEVAQEEKSNGEESKDTAVDDVIYEKISSQLKYYFSDVNLSRDKFMQQQVRQDEGWVPLDLLLKFRRLAAILGDRDKSVIVDALRKSRVLEVNEEGDKVRRMEALPEGYDELRKEFMTRSLYCKGFPLEDITFDIILEFFKSFGEIESVLMRHFMDRASKKRGFKGSVFVTFPTVKQAEDFMALEEVAYKGVPLVRKWQALYIDDKRKERLEDKLKKQQRRRDNRKSGKKGGEEDKGDEREEKDGEDERGGFPLGAVMHFSGLEEGSKVHRDLIRESVESLGFSVAFIDFSRGDLAGYIRLDQAAKAQELCDKVKEESDGKLKLGDEEVELRVLEGEEETNYLDRAKREMNKRRHHHSNKKKHKGRGGHYGGDGGRKRRGGPIEGGPPSKIPATD